MSSQNEDTFAKTEMVVARKGQRGVWDTGDVKVLTWVVVSRVCLLGQDSLSSARSKLMN